MYSCLDLLFGRPRDTRPNGTKDLMDEAMNGVVDPLRIIKLFNAAGGNKRVI